MYRRSFLAPALLLCLWTGAISDVAWAQAPAPAIDPSQATPTPAPAVPPSEKAAEPAQSPSPAPGDKPAAPAPQPAVPEPQAAAPQPGPATVGTLPPASSPPLVRFIELTFPTQGNQSVIDPQTYVYYIQTQISRP